MKYFKGNEAEVIKKVDQLGASLLTKYAHFFDTYGAIPIRDATKQHMLEKFGKYDKPAIIFLRVVLAANQNYNKHVGHNIKRIENDYPNLKTLNDLEALLIQKSKEEFFKFWGHKDQKKYNTLVELLAKSKELKLHYGISDDFSLMKKWSENVSIENIESDPLYKIKNVAIATIQHLRMDFGIDTVKPDQRVMEVLLREFGFKKVNQLSSIAIVEEIAKITGIKIRELDLIFVNYGSGYYDNQNYRAEITIREEIATNLLKMPLDIAAIADATGLTISVVEHLATRSNLR